jgi:hypothetical protein
MSGPWQTSTRFTSRPGKLTVSVKDRQGNMTRIDRTFRVRKE